MSGRAGDQAPGDSAGSTGTQCFIDLHCHTSASFDSLAAPRGVVRAAAARGLTHLAVTDHDRIDGALEAAAIAATEAPGLTVIVGQEIRTRAGDLIGVFLREAIPVGLAPADAISAVRAQGGLVGAAHPFDRFRGSVGRGESSIEELAASLDWIEAWNARLLVGDGNARAAELAARHGIAGVAVSDAHTTLEVGVAATILSCGDPGTPDGLRAALAGPIQLVTGRASAYVRLLGPAAKLVQRARGRGRIRASVANR